MSAQINFDLPLAAFAKKLEIKLEEVCQRVALDALTRIVQRTPVKTGRARSSWNLTVREASDDVPDDFDFQNDAIQRAQGIAAQIDGKEQIFIVSNLPYIERLENGWSKQAPAGMVRLSIAEIEVEMETILEDLAE